MSRRRQKKFAGFPWNLWLLMKSLRPGQWTKNLFIFAGILFSQNIMNAGYLAKVFCAFLVFCALSGAAYVLNDLMDLDSDRMSRSRSKRPLASGRLNPATAAASVIVLFIASLYFANELGAGFFIASLTYAALQVLYSMAMKHVVILDVLSIALGFVIRVAAGAVVIGVEISSWLLICTFLLALFLGMSKRRHELKDMGVSAGKFKKVLSEYSPYLLDQMIAVVTASTVISYTLYTISPETVGKFGTRNLIYTVPFVLYGIFRYLYLIHKKGEGGSPERVIVTDLPLILDIALWVTAAALILYSS